MVCTLSLVKSGAIRKQNHHESNHKATWKQPKRHINCYSRCRSLNVEEWTRTTTTSICAIWAAEITTTNSKFMRRTTQTLFLKLRGVVHVRMRWKAKGECASTQILRPKKTFCFTWAQRAYGYDESVDIEHEMPHKHYFWLAPAVVPHCLRNFQRTTLNNPREYPISCWSVIPYVHRKVKVA